ELILEMADATISKPQETYKYPDLEASDEIRLLILHAGQGSELVRCQLYNVPLATKPTYEAISYTWGDPSMTRAIDCAEQTLQVTLNLYSALQNLRHTDRERILWADAICINQENVKERSQQVGLMAKIYSQSNGVLIWLGEETEDVKYSLSAIEKLHTFFL